jgi:hypothetical protein
MIKTKDKDPLIGKNNSNERIVVPFSIIQYGEVKDDDDLLFDSNSIAPKYIYQPIDTPISISAIQAEQESHVLNTTIKLSSRDGKKIKAYDREAILHSQPVGKQISSEISRKIQMGSRLDDCKNITVENNIKTDILNFNNNSSVQLDKTIKQKNELESYEYKSMYEENGYNISEYKSIYD